MIGDGYDPQKDMAYSTYLAEQHAASRLQDVVAFLPSVPDLDPVYSGSDVFLLSSRLDPQPNVGIDAVLRGLPVVCFEGASGTAEILGADPETRRLVAPHLDAHAAAEIICRLARDRAEHAGMRAAIRRVGQAAYDIDCYIARVTRMGERAADRLREDDRQTLLRSGILDPDLILPQGEIAPGLSGLAHVVQQQWAAVGLSTNQAARSIFPPALRRVPSAGLCASTSRGVRGGWGQPGRALATRRATARPLVA